MRASITESVQNMTVTNGKLANFSCSAVGSDVDIQWKVNDTECENCPAEGHTDICFENSYMNDTATTRSTLTITDSSSLGLGSHTVQCVVKQSLDPEFETEPFQESRTAFLHVEGEGPSHLTLPLFPVLSSLCLLISLCVCVCVCVCMCVCVCVCVCDGEQQ